MIESFSARSIEKSEEISSVKANKDIDKSEIVSKMSQIVDKTTL